MKDNVFVPGIIREKVDVSDPKNKKFIGVTKFFRDNLRKLKVELFDSCCDNSEKTTFPTRVAIIAETPTLQYYDGTEWVNYV